MSRTGNRSETSLIRACQQVAAANGWYCVRVNPHVRERGGRKFVTGFVAGTPDLFLGITRRIPCEFLHSPMVEMVAVETKVGERKQSPEQVAFQKDWERRGGRYILARSIDDLATL